MECEEVSQKGAFALVAHEHVIVVMASQHVVGEFVPSCRGFTRGSGAV